MISLQFEAIDGTKKIVGPFDSARMNPGVLVTKDGKDMTVLGLGYDGEFLIDALFENTYGMDYGDDGRRLTWSEVTFFTPPSTPQREKDHE